MHSGKYVVAIITVATLFIGNITAVFPAKCKTNAGVFKYFAGWFYDAGIVRHEYRRLKKVLLLYAAAYCLATIGIFAVLVKMKIIALTDLMVFAKQQPLVAAATTIVFLLSLAGIPLTAGFLSKFYMLKAAMGAGNNLWLVIFAVLMAAVSVYYYFRVIQAMYFKEGNATVQVSSTFKGGIGSSGRHCCYCWGSFLIYCYTGFISK